MKDGLLSKLQVDNYKNEKDCLLFLVSYESSSNKTVNSMKT